ncbi:hypothetical protein ACHWUR_00090 [Klebsiella pneumoniae]
MQPQLSYNNPSMAKTIFPNRPGGEQELNLTVNMTNVLDGKELANGSYTYTTKLQNREQKEERNFKGGGARWGNLVLFLIILEKIIFKC